MANYFPTEINEHIEQYNNCLDDVKRNHIYEDFIHIPMSKLVECIINKFKFEYCESDYKSVHSECLSHCVFVMKQYDTKKGKAFSYFSFVARNWMIKYNNDNWKRFNKHITHTELEDVGIELAYNDNKDAVQHLNGIIDWLKINRLTYWREKSQLAVIDSLISAMEDVDELATRKEFCTKGGLLTKKGLARYIRLRSGYSTNNYNRVCNEVFRLLRTKFVR